jgi:hypothetical protein
VSSDKNIFPIINIVFLNFSRGMAILDLQFNKIPIIIYEQINQIFSFREKKTMYYGLQWQRCWIYDLLRFFSNRTDRHDITEILLKVALNTTSITLHCRNVPKSFRSVVPEILKVSTIQTQKKCLHVKYI